jgi:hypothetical protein
LNVRPKFNAFFCYSFLGFAVLWAALSFYTTYAEHLRHERLARNDDCRVAEGPEKLVQDALSEFKGVQD